MRIHAVPWLTTCLSNMLLSMGSSGSSTLLSNEGTATAFDQICNCDQRCRSTDAQLGTAGTTPPPPPPLLCCQTYSGCCCSTATMRCNRISCSPVVLRLQVDGHRLLHLLVLLPAWTEALTAHCTQQHSRYIQSPAESTRCTVRAGIGALTVGRPCPRPAAPPASPRPATIVTQDLVLLVGKHSIPAGMRGQQGPRKPCLPPGSARAPPSRSGGSGGRLCNGAVQPAAAAPSDRLGWFSGAGHAFGSLPLVGSPLSQPAASRTTPTLILAAAGVLPSQRGAWLSPRGRPHSRRERAACSMALDTV